MFSFALRRWGPSGHQTAHRVRSLGATVDREDAGAEHVCKHNDIMQQVIPSQAFSAACICSQSQTRSPTAPLTAKAPAQVCLPLLHTRCRRHQSATGNNSVVCLFTSRPYAVVERVEAGRRQGNRWRSISAPFVSRADSLSPLRVHGARTLIATSLLAGDHRG